MLWFIGTGIGGYRGLSISAVDVLKECDHVYVERFTSALGDSDIEGLKALLGKDVKPVQRWFVEDGREIIETAKVSSVAIVTYGDPLIATTHSELRSRAAKSGAGTSVIHSASGIYSAVGEAGLHVYKLGRIVTMMAEPHSAVSVYNTLFQNLLNGSHTLILTEYRYTDDHQPFFLDPATVFDMLAKAELDFKYGAYSSKTFAVVASRVGDKTQQLISGRVETLSHQNFGEGPHSIIITGSLHFTESDALVSLTRALDEPADNSSGVAGIAKQMVTKYAPNAKAAVSHMRGLVASQKDSPPEKGVQDVLDNAEYYISDSERFLNQGRPELAVLCIGYAEGLVDALRFQKGINPWLQPG